MERFTNDHASLLCFIHQPLLGPWLLFHREHTVYLITNTKNGKGLSEIYISLHIKCLLFLYDLKQNQNVMTNCHKNPK